MLKDNADKISGDDKGKIESAVSAVKEALKGSDAGAIKSASEKLNEVWQAVSAELYKAAAAKAQLEFQPEKTAARYHALYRSLATAGTLPT